MARKKIEYPGSLPSAKSNDHLNCPWNDHGVTCGKRGSISDGLNGVSAWYCPEHYWQLKGRKIGSDNRHSGPGPAPCNYPGCGEEGVAGKNPFYCLVHYGHKDGPTWRASWYQRKGIAYEPPQGNSELQLPKTRRAREPGDDDQEITA